MEEPRKKLLIYVLLILLTLLSLSEPVSSETQNLLFNLMSEKMKFLEDKLTQEIQLRNMKEDALRREIDSYKISLEDSSRACQCQEQTNIEHITETVDRIPDLEHNLNDMLEGMGKHEATVKDLHRMVSNVMLYQQEIKAYQKIMFPYSELRQMLEDDRRKMESLSWVYKKALLRIDKALTNINHEQKAHTKAWRAELLFARNLSISLKTNFTEHMRRAEARLKGIGSSVRVAFSASMAYVMGELEDDQRYTFRPHLNVGGAYNEESGTFVAPVPGTYFFISTILSHFDKTIESAIRVNGRSVRLLYSGASNTFGSGSNSVIVELKPGDEVYMTRHHGDTYIHHHWSTFSGFLLFTSP